MNYKKIYTQSKIVLTHFVVFPVFLYGSSVLAVTFIYDADGEGVKLFTRVCTPLIYVAYVSVSLIGAAVVNAWQLARRQSLGKCQGV